MEDKLMMAGMGLLGGFFAINHFTAPTVTRPVYSSQEECLADWANTPQDCEEDRTDGSNGRVRRWYGPWVDRSTGDVYHSNGSRSVRADSSIHASSFSGSKRMGFGSSSSGRGG